MSSDKIEHGLFTFYKEHLPSKLDIFIELGVYKGESLNEFSKWWSNAKIIGVDICNPSVPLNNNVAFIKMSQDDKSLKTTLPSNVDVILDDASHEVELTKKSFEILWNNVKSGGCYIIEDVHKDVLPGMWKLTEDIIKKYNIKKYKYFIKDTLPVASSVILWK